MERFSRLTVLLALPLAFGATGWQPVVAEADAPRQPSARQACAERGPAAVALLLARRGHPDPRVRRQVALALGGGVGDIGGGRRELEALMELALDGDQGVVAAATTALAGLGEPALRAVATRIPGARATEAVALRLLRQRLVAAYVDRVLASLISPSGGWGGWEGQFAPLEPYRDECVPVLLWMAETPENRAARAGVPDDRWLSLRLLAIKAVGKLARKGDDAVLVRLRKIYTAPRRYLIDDDYDDVLMGGVRAALYHLGETRQLEAWIHKLEREVRRYETSDQLTFLLWLRGRLGNAYHTQGAFEKAAKIYLGSLALDADRQGEHYNVACCLSVLGKTDEALKHLVRAIELGYRDMAYIEMDGELANVRAHPDFRQRVRQARYAAPRGERDDDGEEERDE